MFTHQLRKSNGKSHSYRKATRKRRPYMDISFERIGSWGNWGFVLLAHQLDFIFYPTPSSYETTEQLTQRTSRGGVTLAKHNAHVRNRDGLEMYKNVKCIDGAPLSPKQQLSTSYHWLLSGYKWSQNKDLKCIMHGTPFLFRCKFDRTKWASIINYNFKLVSRFTFACTVHVIQKMCMEVRLSQINTFLYTGGKRICNQRWLEWGYTSYKTAICHLQACTYTVHIV